VRPHRQARNSRDVADFLVVPQREHDETILARLDGGHALAAVQRDAADCGRSFQRFAQDGECLAGRFAIGRRKYGWSIRRGSTADAGTNCVS
jgi:hypothetical protein